MGRNDSGPYLVGRGAMMVEMPAQAVSRRPFASLRDAQTHRTLLFLLTALPVGAVALALLIAGWTICLVLAITPLVVPALIGFRAAVGLLARAEAGLARSLLGSERLPG